MQRALAVIAPEVPQLGGHYDEHWKELGQVDTIFAGPPNAPFAGVGQCGDAGEASSSISLELGRLAEHFRPNFVDAEQSGQGAVSGQETGLAVLDDIMAHRGYVRTPMTASVSGTEAICPARTLRGSA